MERKRAPLIGICGVPTQASWGFWNQPAVLTAQTYLDAVYRAGGQPVILPPHPDADVTLLVGTVDGLLFAGGTDIEPHRYGQQATERLEQTSPVRDEFELQVAEIALRQDIPILGICRGLQILTVATGGELHQHLCDLGYAEHRPNPGHLDETTMHTVDVCADSTLGACGFAGVREVNSHHHQGVARVGAGGRVVATSVPDGVIEAVEWPEQTFAVGVQWHPEALAMDALFRRLVQAAARRCPIGEVE